jgi:hypothetical protein
MMYFMCFLGGLIAGGISVYYLLKRWMCDLANMARNPEDMRDPADWWKDA